jgi:hypothetical protein
LWKKVNEGFSYCKLHILYAFQPKNKKEDLIEKDDGVPHFIKKKLSQPNLICTFSLIFLIVS